MKKRVVLSLVSGLVLGLVFLVLLSLILVGVACAQDESGTSPLKEGSVDSETKKLDIPTNISEGLEGVKDIKEKTDTALEQDVKIPENLQIFARVIFGIKGEIPLNIFIIMVCIWIVLFLIIASIFRVIPLFSRSEVVPWLIGAVFTCLISTSGSVRSIAIFLYNFGNLFGFLERWPALRVVIAVVISTLFFLAGSIVLKKINNSIMQSRAEAAGAKAGAGVRMMQETFDQGTGI